MRYVILITAVLVLGGCLPVPLLYLSYFKTGIDTISLVTDNKTTTDYVVSTMTGQNCKTTNIFKDKEYCKEQNATTTDIQKR